MWTVTLRFPQVTVGEGGTGDGGTSAGRSGKGGRLVPQFYLPGESYRPRGGVGAVHPVEVRQDAAQFGLLRSPAFRGQRNPHRDKVCELGGRKGRVSREERSEPGNLLSSVHSSTSAVSVFHLGRVVIVYDSCLSHSSRSLKSERSVEFDYIESLSMELCFMLC